MDDILMIICGRWLIAVGQLVDMRVLIINIVFANSYADFVHLECKNFSQKLHLSQYTYEDDMLQCMR